MDSEGGGSDRCAPNKSQVECYGMWLILGAQGCGEVYFDNGEDCGGDIAAMGDLNDSTVITVLFARSNRGED